MKPLESLKIVSIEQFGAAPYGTMLLAELGATVIKIENASIGADPARKTGPYFLGENDSDYFQSFNCNKKSVSLDLRSEDGRKSLDRLIASADVVMNNMRGDLPAKMGLDYGALSAIKPSIVCVHISAYGRDNERTARPGYDYLMQAESGLMDLTGEPEGLVNLQVRLARANLSDVEPPGAWQFLFGTHPSTLDRLAIAEGKQ